MDIPVVEDPVDSNERGNIGRLVLAKYPERRRHNDFNGGPLMADGEQRPSRALRVMRCERRTSQQLGGLVAVVLRVDVKREQVIELGRCASVRAACPMALPTQRMTRLSTGENR